jgi:hypothetical protein
MKKAGLKPVAEAPEKRPAAGIVRKGLVWLAVLLGFLNLTWMPLAVDRLERRMDGRFAETSRKVLELEAQVQRDRVEMGRMSTPVPAIPTPLAKKKALEASPEGTGMGGSHLGQLATTAISDGIREGERLSGTIDPCRLGSRTEKEIVDSFVNWYVGTYKSLKKLNPQMASVFETIDDAVPAMKTDAACNAKIFKCKVLWDKYLANLRGMLKRP